MQRNRGRHEGGDRSGRRLHAPPVGLDQRQFERLGHAHAVASPPGMISRSGTALGGVKDKFPNWLGRRPTRAGIYCLISAYFAGVGAASSCPAGRRGATAASSPPASNGTAGAAMANAGGTRSNSNPMYGRGEDAAHRTRRHRDPHHGTRPAGVVARRFGHDGRPGPGHQEGGRQERPQRRPANPAGNRQQDACRTAEHCSSDQLSGRPALRAGCCTAAARRASWPRTRRSPGWQPARARRIRTDRCSRS